MATGALPPERIETGAKTTAGNRQPPLITVMAGVMAGAMAGVMVGAMVGAMAGATRVR